MMPPRATRTDWVMLVSLGVIWGGAFMMTRVATEAFQPLSIAGLRLGLGALILWALLRLRGQHLPGLRTMEQSRFWLAAAAAAVLSNAAPFTLLAWAQRHIDSGLAGVFMATVPLFVLPLGHLFVAGERMEARKVLGFALGFAGILVLIGWEALSGLGAGGAIGLAAQGACVVVALCYAGGSIVAKLAPQLGLMRFATASLLLAALMTLPAAVVIERPFAEVPPSQAVLALVYLGVVPTALATLMLLTVIRSAGPGFLSLVNYQVPVWAVVFGTALMGETPSPRLGLALVLILAGLGVARGVLGLRRGGHARG